MDRATQYYGIQLRHRHENYKYSILSCLRVTPLSPCHHLIHLGKIEGGEIESIRPVEEYDSQDICHGRGEEDQRMRRDQLQGTWFLSEDIPYNCYSVLATPVGPVQCWSVSGAHAGLLGEDCQVESLRNLNRSF